MTNSVESNREIKNVRKVTYLLIIMYYTVNVLSDTLRILKTLKQIGYGSIILSYYCLLPLTIIIT